MRTDVTCTSQHLSASVREQEVFALMDYHQFLGVMLGALMEEAAEGEQKELAGQLLEALKLRRGGGGAAAEAGEGQPEPEPEAEPEAEPNDAEAAAAAQAALEAELEAELEAQMAADAAAEAAGGGVE